MSEVAQPQTLTTFDYLNGRLAWLRAEKLKLEGAIVELETQLKVMQPRPVAVNSPAPVVSNRATRRGGSSKAG